MYESSGIAQISTDLIQTGGKILLSEVHNHINYN